jgi:hypothetical protein
MIIYDASNPWAPNKSTRCNFCGCRIRRYPVLFWSTSALDPAGDYCVDLYICVECCGDIYSGFTRDLAQMKNLWALHRQGFYQASPTPGKTLTETPNNKH